LRQIKIFNADLFYHLVKSLLRKVVPTTLPGLALSEGLTSGDPLVKEALAAYDQ
jgi:hypothetical protein